MAMKRTDKKPDPLAIEKFLNSAKEDLAQKDLPAEKERNHEAEEPVRKYTVKIPDSICKKLKMMAVQEDKHLYEIILEAISEKVQCQEK
jgi:hypothetical protein